MCRTCTLAVASEMYSCRAISRLDIPAATSARTSCSRGDRSLHVPVAEASGGGSNRARSFRDLLRGALVLALADVREVAALGRGGRVLVQIHGHVQLAADALA